MSIFWFPAPEYPGGISGGSYPTLPDTSIKTMEPQVNVNLLNTKEDEEDNISISIEPIGYSNDKT